MAMNKEERYRQLYFEILQQVREGYKKAAFVYSNVFTPEGGLPALTMRDGSKLSVSYDFESNHHSAINALCKRALHSTEALEKIWHENGELKIAAEIGSKENYGHYLGFDSIDEHAGCRFVSYGTTVRDGGKSFHNLASLNGFGAYENRKRTIGTEMENRTGKKSALMRLDGGIWLPESSVCGTINEDIEQQEIIMDDLNTIDSDTRLYAAIKKVRIPEEIDFD